MKSYLFSLGAGLLVGFIYSVLKIRSPAPPLIALVGLLGILIGEQALPCAKRMMPERFATSDVHARMPPETPPKAPEQLQPVTHTNEEPTSGRQP
jgi:XapX domain-containing protein